MTVLENTLTTITSFKARRRTQRETIPLPRPPCPYILQLPLFLLMNNPRQLIKALHNPLPTLAARLNVALAPVRLRPFPRLLFSHLPRTPSCPIFEQIELGPN